MDHSQHRDRTASKQKEDSGSSHFDAENISRSFPPAEFSLNATRIPAQVDSTQADAELEEEGFEEESGEGTHQFARAGTPPATPPGQLGGNMGGGLPAQLKAGIESLSGQDMSDVKVHYNSDKPAQFQAEAYAQGSEIHLGPNSQQHLPHEAWHVAQQKRGQVPVTGQENGQNINTDSSLEAEADLMGAKAAQMKANSEGPVQKASASGPAQFMRSAGAPLQFGKRTQRARAKKVKEEKEKNQKKVEPYYELLKEMGRTNRDRVYELNGVQAETMAKGAESDVNLPLIESDLEDDVLSLENIQQETGLTIPDPETCPVILMNAIEAVRNAQKALKNAMKRNTAQHLPHKFVDMTDEMLGDNYDSAFKLLEETAAMVEALPNDETAPQVDLGNTIAALVPGGNKIKDILIRAIPLYANTALAFLEQELGARWKAVAKDFGDDDSPKKAAVTVLDALNDFKEGDIYADHGKAIMRLVQQETKRKTVKAYQDSRVDLGVEGVGELFKEMVADTQGLESESDDPKEFEKGLLEYFGIKKTKAMTSLDDVLQEGIKKHSERIGLLFDETPGLMEQCLKRVKSKSIHKTLLDIKEKGKQHSIQDINDYVGDKLNEPLMRWVIERGIPVEVHATSLLSSFAKMKSEGFTDIVEIPSEHTATKKWICINPETQEAKVVFQTLPGQSYAIQTIGAFLFYEIYDFDPKIKEEVQIENLNAHENVEDAGTFVKAGFKARNIYSEDDEKKEVQFILVSKDNKTFLSATVPYDTQEPEIGKDGEIILYDKLEGKTIAIRDVEVSTMELENLSVFSEAVDYSSVYQDVLQSYGIDQVDIACVGREGAMTKALEKQGVTPVLAIEHMHFRAKLFQINAKDDDTVYNLLTLSISPDFFGDKSGHLVKALTALGVKHISFVGTSGGLAPNSKVGDIMIPEHMGNYAEGELGGSLLKNSAHGLLQGWSDGEDVDTKSFIGSDLHVGVHSPITESQEMIDTMKQMKVSSVDCEAGFIADALKGSNVDFYGFFFVGDVPGTDHSIGQGGVSGGLDEEESDKIAPTEMAVLSIIENAISGKIEDAQEEIEDSPYPMSKDGKITNLFYVPARVNEQPKPAVLQIRVVLPKIATDQRTPGIMRTFHRSLCTILDETKGVLSVPIMNKLNKLSESYLELHKIKFLLNFQ